MKIVNLQNLPEMPTWHNTARKKVIIKKGEVDHLAQFARAVFKPGEKATEHNHPDMYEIFFVERGKGIIKINGVVYQLEKDICITVEPGENHEVLNSGNEELVLTYFEIEKYKPS